MKTAIKTMIIGIISIIIIAGTLISGCLEQKDNHEEELISHPDITILREESCSSNNSSILESYWNNSNLIVKAIFLVNCCPDNIFFDYDIKDNMLNIKLNEVNPKCYCECYRLFVLKIENLERENYTIILNNNFEETNTNPERNNSNNLTISGVLDYYNAPPAIGGESDPSGYILITNSTDNLFENRLYLDFSNVGEDIYRKSNLGRNILIEYDNIRIVGAGGIETPYRTFNFIIVTRYEFF
jgi:hypothetical protein